jgi:hypothetical protein
LVKILVEWSSSLPQSGDLLFRRQLGETGSGRRLRALDELHDPAWAVRGGEQQTRSQQVFSVVAHEKHEIRRLNQTILNGKGGWSRHADSNCGPAVYETAALPLSYVGPAVEISR